MSREIKFRAWHFGMKRMVSCAELVADQMSLLADGRFANVDPRHTKLTEILNHDEMLPMQFTGVKDENGVEIYEGDIVQYDHEDGVVTAEIVFEENDDETMWLSGFAFKFIHDREYDENEPNGFSVIGNMYEHPHLLEKAVTT